MADYPIIFTMVHDLRFEQGAVRVVTKGRVLMVLEDGEWWCHGVEPGGITASGADPAAAFVAFKTAYGGILEDLAQDSKGFAAFERTVVAFVHDKDEAEAERWERARSEVRAGKSVEEPFNGLQRIMTAFEARARSRSCASSQLRAANRSASPRPRRVLTGESSRTSSPIDPEDPIPNR